MDGRILVQLVLDFLFIALPAAGREFGNPVPPLGLDAIVFETASACYSFSLSVALFALAERELRAWHWLYMGLVIALGPSLIWLRRWRLPSAVWAASPPALAPPVQRVIFVPGLNAEWVDAERFFSWLWDKSARSDSVPVPVTTITPKAARVWRWDLGTDRYVDAVVDAVREAATNGERRILLVGNSRGAGVVARALYKIRTDETKKIPLSAIAGAVCLMGPYHTVRGVVAHRYGRWLARVPLLVPFLTRVLRFQPESQEPAPDAHLVGETWPVLFVTSTGDTNIPADAVDHVAKGYRGRLMVLGREVPHSILDCREVKPLVDIRVSLDLLRREPRYAHCLI